MSNLPFLVLLLLLRLGCTVHLSASLFTHMSICKTITCHALSCCIATPMHLRKTFSRSHVCAHECTYTGTPVGMCKHGRTIPCCKQKAHRCLAPSPALCASLCDDSYVGISQRRNGTTGTNGTKSEGIGALAGRTGALEKGQVGAAKLQAKNVKQKRQEKMQKE